MKTGASQEGLTPALDTKFAYDAAGNVTAVTDPKNQTTAYAYDALSRLTAVTQPLGQTVSYGYDPRGRLASVTNARDQVLRYGYEPWGGLAEIEHFADATAPSAFRTVSYTYDLSGNVETTSDTDVQAGPLYTFVPDALDRAKDVKVHYLPGGDRTLASSYDRFGNRKGLAVTDGADVLSHSWSYNLLDRLEEATLAGGATTFRYRPTDELEAILRASGAETTLDYWPQGPLKQLEVRDGSNGLLLGLDYVVDAVGNVDTVTETRPGVPSALFDYGYDGVDRLIQAQMPTSLGLPAQEDFGYDPAGNREDPVDPSLYDHDANNRVTASPGQTWAFDADGNVETRNAGTPAEERFSFDATNRLRRFEADATGVDATYLYDPFGRRIRKTVNGATTWFLWDGDQLLAEYDGAGTRQRRYTYAGGFAPLEMAVGSTAASETVYAVDTDHLDTPRLLTDAAGQAVWRASYRAFGEGAIDEDPDGDGQAIAFPIRFPGQYLDGESGLHYNRFRYYDAGVGRYISADPIGQAGGVNVYNYALNNPSNFADPSGLLPPRPGDSLVGRAVGAVAMARREASDARAEALTRQTAGEFGDPTTLPAGKEFPGTSDFQHCMASCEITRQGGSGLAKAAGDLNEVVNGAGVGSLDNAIDQAANAHGRSVGESATCEPDCRTACSAFATRPSGVRTPAPPSSPVEIPVGRAAR